MLTTSDPRIFFQIAAALIPTLVFGGLLSDRLKPPTAWPRYPAYYRRHLPWAMVFGALVVFYGEATAIEVGLTGSPDQYQTWLVAGVVVGLTAFTLSLLVWPWVK